MPTVFPTDFVESRPHGATTPTGRPMQSPSRRETILSLVEMLLKQGDEAVPSLAQQPNFEDDRDVPTVDEHLQVVGAEAFNKFQRRINNLDKELRNFANAARQLGSSVAILSSAFHLRERLAQILYLYRENAADLFPRKVTRISREFINETQTIGRRRRRGKSKQKTPPHVSRPIVMENLDLEFFPQQLEALATDVMTFLNCLNEFPEFTDEAVNASISSFEGDLKYWASCLREYAGHFRYPAVQRYIHDLSMEMGEHIDSITSTLSMFIEVGVPTIRFAQKHGAANLLNLSTVATFFSAVTATTIQYSFDLPHSGVADAVNCFWFASLVFSIAAAVNSLLGLTWKQAMYRSPGDRVPWWVLIWIKRSPLVFLVVSVACFSIGLCCFAYASEQAQATSTMTTVFTAITSFGLTAVSTWFASERWIFLRHRGQKWLGDAIFEYQQTILRMPGMIRLRQMLSTIQNQFHRAHALLGKITSGLGCVFHRPHGDSDGSDDLEAGTLPIAFSRSGPSVERLAPPRRHSDLEPNSPIEPSKSFSVPASPIEKEAPAPPTPPSPGKQLWRDALRSIKMRSLLSAPNAMSALNALREPHRQRTSSSNLTGSASERKRTMADEPVNAVLRSRVAALVPKLKIMEATQDLAAHSALVRHLQFSPDGKYLATSSWDRTSIIFRVGEPFVSHRVLAHAKGFVGQVAWSPTGHTLLTKLNRAIKVWTAEDGVCKKTIDRQASVEAVTWFPDGQTFISVEANVVTKLDLSGKVIEQYHFGKMKLHDVAITPDSLRLIGVGPLLESPSGLQPSKSRAEKQLVVYNMETKQVENRTPVLNDVRDITVAQNNRSGIIALVSYENKAPPQLWKLELVKDRENNTTIGRLTLRHTYMPKAPVDFAGPSYFGGKNHELVLCAGKGGDIHIWDQESGALLHNIRTGALGGDLTCIAWNLGTEDPFMFATGSHDGAVRVWTKRQDSYLQEHDNAAVGASILRTQSPSELGEQDRSDSPLTQQDLDSISSHSSQNDGRTSIRDRVVAFASMTPGDAQEYT